MQERLKRVMVLTIALIMLAGPLVSAQSATPQATDLTDAASTSDAEEPESSESDEGGDAAEADEEPVPSADAAVPPSEADGEDKATTPGAVSEPEREGDEELPETQHPDDADDADDGAPPAGPAPQTQNRGIQIQAARTLIVTVVTADGAPVPAGTEVCIWPSADASCQDWSGEELRFTPTSTRVEYELYAPESSGYAENWGSMSVPSGQTVPLTLTLRKKATVEITLAPESAALEGTEVCIWPAVGCQTWEGVALRFSIAPGTSEYEVIPPVDSGFAPALGTLTAAPGEEVSRTITLQAPAKVNVKVISADGNALPNWVQVCLQPSQESCGNFVNQAVAFNVAPGEVQYEAMVGSEQPYRDTTGTITVAPGETRDLTITLQPKDPAKLRVYVTTQSGQPVPAGTEICVDLPEPEFGPKLDNECQVLTGTYAIFATGQGWADITVTPPDGSDYVGEIGSAYTRLDETTRFVLELERSEDAESGQVAITAAREGDRALTEEQDLSIVCLYTGDFALTGLGLNCAFPDESEPHADGSLTVRWSGLEPGTYNYLLGTRLPGYGTASGTVTVVAGQTATANVTIPLLTHQDLATLIARVITVDGSPVPQGTVVCAVPVAEMGDDVPEEEVCQEWTKDPLTFQVPAALVIYAAGNLSEESGPTSLPGLAVLTPGETRSVTITLYPDEFDEGITHTVSNTNPESGETVTYTIHAWGQVGIRPAAAAYEPWIGFQIENALPAELSNITVSCTGIYQAAIPGICHEVEDGVLTVFGQYEDFFGEMGFFDITITVTGTVVGDAGTVVENTACLINGQGGNDVPVGSICNIAVLTIAAQPVDPETPVEPEEPVDPEIPVDPEQPTDPEVPVEPETPVDPETPIKPEEPTKPESPADREEPTSPDASADPETPSTPASAVTTLPQTGHGAQASSMLAIYTGLAAAMLLGGAGLVLRVRKPVR